MRADVVTDIRPGQLWMFRARGGGWALFIPLVVHDKWCWASTVMVSDDWSDVNYLEDEQCMSERAWALGRHSPVKTDYYEYTLVT